MRKGQGRSWAAGVLVALGLVGMCHALGCSDSADKHENELDRQRNTTTTSSSSGVPPGCEKHPEEDPSTITEQCGVFVRASAPAGGNGTKAQPFNSFAELAASDSQKSRVYVCHESQDENSNKVAESYNESSGIVFRDGVEVYGGFTGCYDEWTWSTNKTKLTVAVTEEQPDEEQPETQDTIALTLNGGDNRLENLEIIASGTLVHGNSSIALLVNGGKAYIVNSDLTAGDAGDGDPGITPVHETDPNGIAGIKGHAACDPGTEHPGKDGPVKQCPGGEISAGGRGGAGSASGPAGSGEAGTPASDRGGAGGKGAQSAGSVCTEGASGEPGKDGTPGAPVETPDLGTIDATGYQGVNGVQGKPGAPGQGGGGGGGAMGGTATCPGADTSASLAGASGGTGGSGGCGGLGGEGGKPGGSSIAVIVLNADVTFKSVQLTAGNAGNGGIGGDGALGGTGGAGGDLGAGVAPTLRAGCRGGSGGEGGQGGPGGGGPGGHALGIAFNSNSSLRGEVPSFIPGNEGQGGLGSSMPPAGAEGAPGRSGACLNFDTGNGQGCLQ